MTALPIATRLRYLNDSAHLLAMSAPATASYLMSQYHNVAIDHELAVTDARKREVCGACGNITMSGWSSCTYLESPPKKRGKSGAAKAVLGSRGLSEADRVIIYQCRICNRKTRQTFQKGCRERRLQHRIPLPSPASFTRTYAFSHQPIQASIGQSSINSSSRKRAKIRKQSGLQAMLARAKTGHAKSGPSRNLGLDLMDLMKTR